MRSGPKRCYFFYRDLIVPAHHYFSPQLPQILHQVVGKGIVIVEDKNHSSSDYIRRHFDFPRAGQRACADTSSELPLDR